MYAVVDIKYCGEVFKLYKLGRQKIHLYGLLKNRLLKRVFFINGLFIFNYMFWRLLNRNARSQLCVYMTGSIVLKI